MIEFIVKIQQSLSSSDSMTHILIYGEGQDISYEFNSEDDPEIVTECLSRLSDRPKAYFNAQHNESDIKLLEEVQTQNW